MHFPLARLTLAPALVAAGLTLGLLPGCKTFATRSGAETPLAPPSAGNVQRDLQRLPEHLLAIETLRGQTLEIARDVRGRGESEQIYTPAEEEAIFRIWSSFLFHNNQLIEIYRENTGFATATDPVVGRRALAAYVMAGFAVYRNAVLITSVFDANKRARHKLNEAYVPLGIPDHQYDVLREIAMDDENFRATIRSLQYFNGQEEELRRDPVLGAFRINHAGRTFNFVDTLFHLQTEIVLLHQNTPALSNLDRPLEDMGKAAKVPLYSVQSNVSMFFGHTRSPLAEDAFSVGAAIQVGKHLQPGDILLTRSDGYLSNLFLPGFWKHALIYAGSREEMERLGLLRDPGLAAKFDKFVRKHARPTGERGVTLEAVGEGVVVSDLPTSLQANHVIALRPRTDTNGRLRALQKALAFLGTPYDFDFEFATANKLVCSELVYQVYGILGDPFRFPLSEIAGRKVVAPYSFVQQALEPDQKGIAPRAFDVVLIASSGSEGELKLLQLPAADGSLQELAAKSVDSLYRTGL